jgi:hypothetical protein
MRRRGTAVLGLMAALVLFAGTLAACTTTTNGRGTALVPALRSSAPTPTPTPSAGTTAATPGGPSTAVPPPPSCPQATCRQQLSASLTAPYTVAVWAAPASAGNLPAAVVELAANGAAVSWTTLANQSPSQLSCISDPGRSNCVIVGTTGAHSSVASVWRLTAGALVQGASVQAATPTMQAGDLNSDGWVDVAGLQNDYTPNYAAGKEYWQTWRSDGVQLTSTGCTAPSHSVGNPPTVLLTGNCP